MPCVVRCALPCGVSSRYNHHLAACNVQGENPSRTVSRFSSEWRTMEPRNLLPALRSFAVAPFVCVALTPRAPVSLLISRGNVCSSQIGINLARRSQPSPNKTVTPPAPHDNADGGPGVPREKLFSNSCRVVSFSALLVGVWGMTVLFGGSSVRTSPKPSPRKKNAF